MGSKGICNPEKRVVGIGLVVNKSNPYYDSLEGENIRLVWSEWTRKKKGLKKGATTAEIRELIGDYTSGYVDNEEAVRMFDQTLPDRKQVESVPFKRRSGPDLLN